MANKFLRSFWQRTLYIKKQLALFVAIFGVLWLFAEPLGLKPGLLLFSVICFGAVVISTVWLFGSKLYSFQETIERQRAEIFSLKKKLSKVNKYQKYCLLLKKEASVCPLGVTAIYKNVRETLTSSLRAANNNFRWLGLSGFNVVHNSRDIFEQKKQVKFEFVTVSPKNELLINAIDEFYMDLPGTLRSKNLIQNSNAIMADISANVHRNLKVFNVNQMPTFRIVLIDDSKALVSFYERGIDALKVHQLEITENKDAPYSMLKWFKMFYEKTILTENFIRPAF